VDGCGCGWGERSRRPGVSSGQCPLPVRNNITPSAFTSLKFQGCRASVQPPIGACATPSPQQAKGGQTPSRWPDQLGMRDQVSDSWHRTALPIPASAEASHLPYPSLPRLGMLSWRWQRAFRGWRWRAYIHKLAWLECVGMLRLAGPRYLVKIRHGRSSISDGKL
jgi:hypothetical protein